ncbi:crotonase/enoyl-CoA hydratase family protein [Nocardia sp. AG03]|uniref:crotonase/enoyl-CoA hydratase family protein n=1 Tax=Nocardia sp. AG03 TaxID=3025312 RepID=UPI002418614D|nr:crotonase/enoyl-CoA hydratase family protein [Nocardia sp. AG03]
MTDNNTGAVTLRTEGRIAIITVDNVAKKNSYTPEMLEQVSEHLTTFDDRDDLWVAVFCSAGDHTTAGLDMPKFFGPTATAKPLPDNVIDPFGLGPRRTYKPVIAVVQGLTYTVGIEMMLAADIVIAADSARFQQLESRRGIAPLGGAHFRYLTRTGWGNAMYHLLQCEEFGAQRALELGFVQEVVPHGTQLERALEVANTITKNAPLGLRAMKEAALKYVEVAEKAAIDEIPRIREEVFASEDFKEGIQSFVERREAHFSGR